MCATVPVVWTASGENKLRLVAGCWFHDSPKSNSSCCAGGCCEACGGPPTCGQGGGNAWLFPRLVHRGPRLRGQAGIGAADCPQIHSTLLGIASGGQCRRSRRLTEVSLVRCSPAERLMRTSQIIPVKKRAKAALLFDAVGRWTQVDPFVLHGPPQALDEDVVVAAPASVHADLDPAIPRHLGELVAGELRALIGIEDVGLAEPGEGLAQRLDTEPRRQRVRQPPGQHPSGRPVDDRDQVQKPLLHGYVGYVSCPP